MAYLEDLKNQIEQEEEKENNNSETSTSEKKLFSQEEVNEIIKKRLNRQKEKLEKQSTNNQDYEDKLKELEDREKTVSFKEYLVNNRLPVEILNIISARTLEEFKEKIDALKNINLTEPIAPLKNPEINRNTNYIDEAFKNPKHKPRFSD